MKQLNVLLSDKETLKQVMRSENPPQAYELLKERGLSCDYGNFLEFAEATVVTYEKQQSGLLTEADMDNLLDKAENTEMVGTPTVLLFMICKS